MKVDRWPQRAGRVLAIVLIAGVAACSSQTSSSSPAVHSSSPVSTTSPATHRVRAAVPPVEGLALSDARQVLNGHGFYKLSSEPEPNTRYPVGQVTATTPYGGKYVRTDITVIVFVSGTQRCPVCSKGLRARMPPVYGLTFQHANTVLVEHGITVDPRSVMKPSAKPRGTVIGSAPGPNVTFTAYGPGARQAVLTVSSG